MMKSLKDWLDAEEMTQAEFAAAIEVHESLVSQWLHGRTKPSLSRLQRVATRTGIPVATLVDELTLSDRA